MSDDMTAGILIFVLVVVFGSMMCAHQIAKPADGYVTIPSNRYCEGMGYEKPAVKQEDKR